MAVACPATLETLNQPLPRLLNSCGCCSGIAELARLRRQGLKATKHPPLEKEASRCVLFGCSINMGAW